LKRKRLILDRPRRPSVREVEQIHGKKTQLSDGETAEEAWKQSVRREVSRRRERGFDHKGPSTGGRQALLKQLTEKY